ncbi:hypothetical protein F5I97DRAFT_1802807 [Phlebopus sp. FC_14]|nr:hypothetical protein F5I97DRAFT_1802807 [Phlebopus sp. FC_14]
MASRVFALLIGVDDYKSGRIWNLEACADDARRMKQWLIQDLRVPSPNISLLLNKDATQRCIEDTFMSHLVNNPAISRGDALLIYFAGHGSTMSAPRDWCEGKPRHVQVLCPYDHDTKGPHGRIAGISDRSLFAMLGELSDVKGDNITLILDCCFSALQLTLNQRDRRFSRCTPTEKAQEEDLFAGLWRGAIGKKFNGEHGFYQDHCQSHVLLAACKPGEMAMEWKEGGKFSQAFLEVNKSTPFHQLKYYELPERLAPAVHGQQRPVCLGRHKDRIIFDGIPFVPDTSFVPVHGHKDGLRLHIGAIHGVVEGTEFSVHYHNIHGSLNPSLDSFRVYEVHPTWSLARRKSISKAKGRGSWARITRWNARTPLRIYVKKTFSSIFRRLFCRPELDGIPIQEGSNIVEVGTPAMADISVGVHTRQIRVRNLDYLVAPRRTTVLKIDKYSEKSVRILDEAARYHMHLHRANPENPFRDLLRMELFLLDPHSRERSGPNLLVNGEARIIHQAGDSYAVVLHNYSDSDLWPYLAYMDSNGVDIHLLYHPKSAGSPTLLKHGSLEIDYGAVGFMPSNPQRLDCGFLKLFVSTSYTSMGILEQSSTPIQPEPSDVLIPPRPHAEHGPQDWDTALATLRFSSN